MSGVVCEIIIRMNRLKALMDASLLAWPSVSPVAQYATANATAICEVADGEYSASFTDQQKVDATVMMKALNDVVQPIADAGFHHHSFNSAKQAMTTFVSLSDSLLNSILP